MSLSTDVYGVVLAAGRGRRLAPYTDAVPKELLPIGDKPVIQYCVEALRDAGVKRIFIVLSQGKDAIIEYLKDGSRFDVRIAYLYQDLEAGIGTAKAIEASRGWVYGDFIVMYGDTFFHPSDFVSSMLSFHYAKNSKATIGLYHVVGDPRRFGIVRIDSNYRILELVERPPASILDRFVVDGGYLVNSGPLIFSQDIFRYIEKTGLSPDGEYWVTESIRLMIADGLPIYGYRIPNGVFWRDVGTQESRLEAERYALEKLNPRV
ncbi:MAG: nucleotidyltransferase family protein [Candidatus Bathyarchaeota archaeon]|nr:nucleotidyltransferase family protein [Candidatus Bathyarchaeota archaeon]